MDIFRGEERGRLGQVGAGIWLWTSFSAMLLGVVVMLEYTLRHNSCWQNRNLSPWPLAADGDYGAAVEANPIAYPLRTHSPGLFAGLAAVWLVVLSAVVLMWRHPLGGWMAVFVAVAHALGGASWLTRTGPLGLVLAVVYLATTAQLSVWCWKRYARRSASDALPVTS